jgi:signal transduction histidine kinase
MLRLAIRNLVENAIRYTPRDGNVAAGIDNNGSGPIRSWVRDSGPGIMSGDLPHLTERFYRGHNVTAEGSGLGLAIAKRVAELNNAQLHLKNKPEGGLEAALEWGLPGKLDS